ncbi:S41 family peptidase [Pseudoalteromonas sp. SMS1]|uniref:S41 family peptidase n=1 Tax=Pseudoalteromonas sp. SMS1 TaxID=2908894 RepID=UPI001F1699F7|nr:S41 family peptidase [Pseudoalteromonas sp. SMS1]MCF2858387.1 S41 family peptidase [Pseudoalteromonas sp. SMS1]
MMNNNMKAIITALLMTATAVHASSDNSGDYALDRIEAFSKIANLVEFYHPSESVQATDWEQFSKYGAHYIQQNTSQDFASQLKYLFNEVAPHVTFNDYLTEPERLREHDKVSGWINLGYPSKLGHYSFRREVNTINYGQLHTEPFLPQQQVYYAQLNGVYVRVPMLLEANKTAKDGGAYIVPAHVNIPDTLENPFYCFSVMSKVWGVMAHFGQYFHHVPVNWGAELRPLLSVCQTQDARKIENALKYTLTKLQDNHVYLYLRDVPAARYWPDVGFEMVEGKPVLIYKGSKVDELEVGDELVAVDGQDIRTLINEKIPYSLSAANTAASDVLGNEVLLRENPTDTVTLDIVNRDNQPYSVQLVTDKLRYESYYNTIDNYTHSSQATHQVLDKHIHYLDLSKVTNEALPGLMKKLETARGIIVDLRNYPSDWFAWQNFLTSIHDGKIEGPVYKIRVSNHPDYEQRHVFNLDLSRQGTSQRLNKPMVVLSSRYSISRNEFVLAFFQNLNIPVVGEATKGINGDLTYVLYGDVPYHLAIGFTGAEVRQADGSKLIGVGVQPDILVSPTLDDIRNNHDTIKDTAKKYLETLIQ